MEFRRKTSRLAVAFMLLTVCELLALVYPASAKGQAIRARIRLASVVPATVSIDIEFPVAIDSLSFRNSYGDVLGLGERITEVEAIKGDERLRIQPLAPGEFRTAERFFHFRYNVTAAPPSRAPQMSHVSWVNRDQGLLMPGDLLPLATSDSANSAPARITIDLPAGWSVAGNVKRDGSEFLTEDPENAVFLVGPAVAEKTAGQHQLSIVTSGQWPFADKDALKIARRIIREYANLTGFELKREAVVMLIPYPGEAGPESWSAETRGNVVVLLLGRKASAKRVLSRLGIVLSHELFHLWVPNSLKFVGSYDWFFEGFTLYQALLTDLRLRLISFDDYLATLARVYDSYLSSVDRDRLSLIEASDRRWTTASKLVYEKGMLAAFTYDLSLRHATDCKSSIEDVYRNLFALPQTGQENANETIIRLLTEREGLASFARDYVESANEIKLDSVVALYGLKVERTASGTRMVVDSRLSKSQKRLLGCIDRRR